jgi:DNA-directed RNA polymerase specialized sigma24 family protein
MYLSAPVILLSLDEIVELDRLDLLESGPSGTPRPVEVEAEEQVTEEAVRRFVASLPTQDRDLVEGVFWLGHSQADFARLWGLSRMAITKRLKKIYQRASVELAVFSPTYQPC